MNRFAVVVRLVQVLVIASLIAPLLPPRVVTAAPYDPKSDFTLADLGFGDQVLRGSSATLEMYFPGPGRFRIGNDNVFVLILGHAEILDARVSTATFQINGVPLRTWFLAAETSRPREIAIQIPASLMQPDVNLLALRFTMRLPREGCADTEHPALSATVFRQTRLHYDFLDGFPRTPPNEPDLGRFPLTLLEPNTIVPDRLTLVVPDEPEVIDLRAAMNVAAGVGRSAGGRPVGMELRQARDAVKVLGDTDLVVVGKPQTNALWATPEMRARAQLPIPLDRAKGEFQAEDGRTVEPHEGVLMDVLSPWNPDLRLVLVTGQTDEALVRASTALSSLTARKSLFGASAVITEMPQELAPEDDTARRDSLTDFTLAELGEGDRTVSGTGTHVLTVSFDSTGSPERGARASVIFDHTRLINNGQSSLAVTLNDVPLLDTRLTTERAAGRQTLEVPLPPRVLRPGRNALLVRFYFAQGGAGVEVMRSELGNEDRFPICGTSPTELYWGVLYSDSSIHLPPGTGGSAGLGSLPFPFIREGNASGMLIVLPDDMRAAGLAPALAAELGRSVRTDVLDLAVTTYSRLTAEQRRDHHLVVFGTAAANPLFNELGPSLPLHLDSRGRVVQGPGAPLAGVRDGATLGILQTVPSPFNPARGVLAVTATNNDGLELALRALRQGGLSGNLATVQAPEEGTQLLRVRTFDVPLARAELPPVVTIQEAAPNLLAVVVAAGTVLLLIATAASMVVASRRRATRVGTDAPEDASEEDDWLAGLETTLPRSR